MRIQADYHACIGAGNCVLAAQDVFDQNDEATVVLLTDTPSAEQEGRVKDAVAQCPSGALSVVDE